MKKIILTIIMILVTVNSAFAQGARPQGSRTWDSRVVAVNELSDVKGDEWAYKAVAELVEKYDVLEGYPDETFRGKDKSTRFELAAAVYDLATYLGDEIALDREDLAKLAKLLDEFSNELKALQGRVDKLEGTVADHDKRITTLEGKVADHDKLLAEHEKRLAYAERRKGFILERLIKGLVVDARDVTRGLVATVTSPFNSDVLEAIKR